MGCHRSFAAAAVLALSSPSLAVPVAAQEPARGWTFTVGGGYATQLDDHGSFSVGASVFQARSPTLLLGIEGGSATTGVAVLELSGGGSSIQVAPGVGVAFGVDVSPAMVASALVPWRACAAPHCRAVTPFSRPGSPHCRHGSRCDSG